MLPPPQKKSLGLKTSSVTRVRYRATGASQCTTTRQTLHISKDTFATGLGTTDGKSAPTPKGWGADVSSEKIPNLREYKKVIENKYVQKVITAYNSEPTFA